MGTGVASSGSGRCGTGILLYMQTISDPEGAGTCAGIGEIQRRKSGGEQGGGGILSGKVRKKNAGGEKKTPVPEEVDRHHIICILLISNDLRDSRQRKILLESDGLCKSRSKSLDSSGRDGYFIGHLPAGYEGKGSSLWGGNNQDRFVRRIFEEVFFVVCLPCVGTENEKGKGELG